MADRVHVGTVDAVATQYETFDDVPVGVTFNDVGWTPTATMEQD